MKIGSTADGLSLLLPIAFIVTVWLAGNVAISMRHGAACLETWFAAVAGGYVCYLFVGLVGVETLSAFDALHRLELIVWWGVYILSAGASSALLHSRHDGKRTLGRPAWTSIATTAAFGAIASFLFWLGATTEPNNADSMNYHLVRAATWATDGNVNNYLTYVPRQLYYGRLAEYFITQMLVLDGNDHLAFVPQWLAFVVTVVMVAGLARQLSGGRRSAAIIGVVFAGTLPLGIMQATATNNDMFVASIVMSSFYLAAILWKLRRPDPIVLTLLGLASGMAVLTKTDAALVLAPLLLALVGMAWRDRWLPRATLRWGGVALLAALAVTLPMTLRNWETFHNVNGLSSSEQLTVSTHAPGPLLLNGIRSILNNLDTLRPNLNADISRFVAKVGRPIGLDGSSPQTSFYPYPTPGDSPSEDASGSLVAFVALIIAAGALFWPSVRRRVVKHQLVPVGAAASAGLALVVLGLKWQPWGARFQLMALFPLLACAAAVISALEWRRLLVVGSLLGAASLVLLPFSLFENVSKALIVPPGAGNYLSLTRNEQLLRWCPAVQTPYTNAVSRAAADGQHELGYVTPPHLGYIYPMWVLLSQKSDGAPVNVVPVGVNNATGRYSRTADGWPDITLVLGYDNEDVEQEAKIIKPLGYHLQAMTPTQCEVVGTYVRGR